jgi:hypothetical protein
MDGYPQCKTCEHYTSGTYISGGGKVIAPYGNCDLIFLQFISHERGDECASDCALSVDEDFGCIAHSSLEGV